MRRLLTYLLALGATFALGQEHGAFPEIPRRLPPLGIEIPEAVRAELAGKLTVLGETFAELEHPRRADIGVLLKGVQFALINGEFYAEKDFDKARRHLALAETWLADPEAIPKRGLLVRGYESSIDGSFQPYGLEVPEKLDRSKPVPILVWLHGRGDKTTDLHFIEQCLTKSQAFQGKIADQEQCIVIHPFGRQCVGWKHAGEIDVFEAIADAKRALSLVPSKQLLAGFSMGGAGAWHIGAHYSDRFAAVHAGAGFVETAEYNKLKPEDHPVWYEKALWGLYDVPNYARNLLNLPVIAYSGEDDKQKQAADLMARELLQHGHGLEHVIGPGMGHKYHPDAVKPIFEALLAAEPRDSLAEVHFQTQTLRYARLSPLWVTGLEEHWQDSRIDVKLRQDGTWVGTTKNVSSFVLPNGPGQIDGQNVGSKRSGPLKLQKVDGQWQPGSPGGLRKLPGLQGPIDDAFMAPFLVVLPDQPSEHPAIQRWLDFEIAHFAKRWRELMRGHLPMKRASSVTKDDVANFNLICWGEPSTNAVIGATHQKLPLTWDAMLQLGDEALDAASHLPLLIYPNPLNPERYLVLNSGLTFREDHDRTNSLQNPKLPDWALVDAREAPTGSTPGKIIDAGFFGEKWEITVRNP